MEVITGKTFDGERALYGSKELRVEGCRFDGPADGESAFKECQNIEAADCFFNLRYPFWHDKGLKIERSELTELCRAALWYSSKIEIVNSKLHGIKALRECSDVKITGCDIISPEFGWSVNGVEMVDCNAESEYFMMRSENLNFKSVNFKGKYSFQYIENSVFDGCFFDTKDAFWHGKNIVIKNSVVKGEYLAWYSQNLVFENCKIYGAQPLCYCKKLQLKNCEMYDADLAFERSDVRAEITTHILSVKNPMSGYVCAPSVGEIIRDIDGADGKVCCGGNKKSCA